jgi:hypothetical protein
VGSARQSVQSRVNPPSSSLLRESKGGVIKFRQLQTQSFLVSDKVSDTNERINL